MASNVALSGNARELERRPDPDKPIHKGELITYDDATPLADSKIVQLRALQDQMIFGG